jgi:hypothetical protein
MGGMTTPDSPPPQPIPNGKPILPAAEARRRYLIYVGVRFAGLAVMACGVWLGRAESQVLGLAVVIVGGLSMLLRPRHLGLSRKP